MSYALPRHPRSKKGGMNVGQTQKTYTYSARGQGADGSVPSTRDA